MDIFFTREGSKLYAATPHGELAFGEQSGLYEWRDRQRTDYCGGDRQHSGGGVMWQADGGDGGPALRGFGAAVSRARLN